MLIAGRHIGSDMLLPIAAGTASLGALGTAVVVGLRNDRGGSAGAEVARSVTPAGDVERAIDTLVRPRADVDDQQPTVQVDDAAMERIVRRLDREVAWRDDGRCYYRAMYAAAVVDQELGIGVGGGVDDARAAAIAFVPGTLAKNAAWTFHAAVAVRDAAGAVRILDPLTRSTPMSVDEWLDANGATHRDLTWLAPEEQGSFHDVETERGRSVVFEMEQPWSRAWLEEQLR